MPSRSKALGNGAVGRQKTLGMPGRLEPLHAILTLPCGAMRVLTPVIEVAALTVLYSWQYLACGRAIAFEFIRHDDPWHVPQPLQALTEKLLRRLLMPPALHEDIEDVIVLVDSAPEVMALPVDRQEHLIQVPLIPWLGASVLQLIRVVLPKLPTPLADGLMGHVDATLAQDLLYVAVAVG
jgi:hypothetical protein